MYTIYIYIYIYIYLYIYIIDFFSFLFSLYSVFHRNDYTPHIFVNMLLYLFQTEEITLCYNVK